MTILAPCTHQPLSSKSFSKHPSFIQFGRVYAALHRRLKVDRKYCRGRATVLKLEIYLHWLTPSFLILNEREETQVVCIVVSVKPNLSSFKLKHGQQLFQSPCFRGSKNVGGVDVFSNENVVLCMCPLIQEVTGFSLQAATFQKLFFSTEMSQHTNIQLTFSFGRNVICVEPPPRSKIPTVFLVFGFKWPEKQFLL